MIIFYPKKEILDRLRHQGILPVNQWKWLKINSLAKKRLDVYI